SHDHARSLPSFPTRRSSDLPADAVAQEVVAEVHDEGAVPEGILRGEHGVGEPPGRVLLDVGDPRAEARAVADRLADLAAGLRGRSEEHTSELQSRENLVCRL